MKTKCRKTITTILGLVTALSATACGGSGQSQTTGSAGPGASANADNVTVNSLQILSLAPMMVADSKGFFTKHNIKVTFSNADIYSRLAVQSQGNLDVNIPGVGGALFNAINQKLKLRAVALQTTCCWLAPRLTTPV